MIFVAMTYLTVFFRYSTRIKINALLFFCFIKAKTDSEKNSRLLTLVLFYFYLFISDFRDRRRIRLSVHQSRLGQLQILHGGSPASAFFKNSISKTATHISHGYFLAQKFYSPEKVATKPNAKTIKISTTRNGVVEPLMYLKLPTLIARVFQKRHSAAMHKQSKPRSNGKILGSREFQKIFSIEVKGHKGL